MRKAAAAVVLAVALAACSTGSPTHATARMQGIRFTPGTIVVRAGGTVTWKNFDDVAHTVTAGTPAAPTGLFDSGNKVNGETFTVAFPTAGTYGYFCSNHAGMHGVVKVTSSGS
jgi:plastocyanin